MESKDLEKNELTADKLNQVSGGTELDSGDDSLMDVHCFAGADGIYYCTRCDFKTSNWKQMLKHNRVEERSYAKN